MDSVEKRILSNLSLLDAVGFTGGEPSLQPQPVTELCRWARENGLRTFLNTNGSNPDFVRELSVLCLLDYVALDVKAPLRPDAYGPVVGLESGVEEIVRRVRETIRVCREMKVPLEARTTVVPTLVDSDNVIREIARSVRGCNLYILQEFSPFDSVLDEKLRKLKPPSRELLIRLARGVLDEGVNDVYIRTRRGGLEKVTIP